MAHNGHSVEQGIAEPVVHSIHCFFTTYDIQRVQLCGTCGGGGGGCLSYIPVLAPR